MKQLHTIVRITLVLGIIGIAFTQLEEILRFYHIIQNQLILTILFKIIYGIFLSLFLYLILKLIESAIAYFNKKNYDG